MRRRQLLVLSFFPAFHPPRSGGEVRLWNLHDRLADRFDVTLLSSGHVGAAPARVLHRPGFVEHRIGKDAAFLAAYEHLRGMAGPGDISSIAVGLAARTVGAFHEAFLRLHADADLIVHESPFTLGYDPLFGLDGKPRVFNSHNAEHALMHDLHPGPRAARPRRYVEEAERALTLGADLVVTCAEEDRAALERLAGITLPNTALAPNGTTPPRDTPPARAVARALLFIGSQHAPNVEAARFLIERMAPALPPGLMLQIVGACAPAGRPAPNVTCHGMVDAAALERLRHEADIALNPVASGSGSNVKVLDYMGAGLPIVATRFGMRGTFAEPGVHFIAAEGDAFGPAVASLAADPASRQRLATACAALVRDRLDWGVIARALGDRLAALASPAPGFTLRVGEQAAGANVLLDPSGPFGRDISSETTVLRAGGSRAVAIGLHAALRPHASAIVPSDASRAWLAAGFGDTPDHAPPAAKSSAVASQRRMLVVTYRATDPSLGGAELMLTELLRVLDAGGAWEIDVVASDAGTITDVGRFACRYGDAAGYDLPSGFDRTTWRRFPRQDRIDPAELARAWDVEPAFWEALAADPALASRDAPCLHAGWHAAERDGGTVRRWTAGRASLHAGAGGRLTLKGFSPAPTGFTVETGGVTLDGTADGAFAFTAELAPGIVTLRAETRRIGDDPRPLGLCVTSCAIDGTELVGTPTAAEAVTSLPFPQAAAALDRAARATRGPAGVALTALRGPHAPAMTRWLDEHVAEYGVVLTHNCVFAPAAEAVAAARSHGVPSVIVAHAHLDDDFYHFPDVIRTLDAADTVLVSPRAAVDALRPRLDARVEYLPAGIHAEEFGEDGAAADIAAFDAVVPPNGPPILLVLGRKAAAKNYRAVLAAGALLRRRDTPARVVLIGPDEDRAVVPAAAGLVLGQQPRSVVRGALRRAAMLCTMSISESFGIVLLEAWMAGTPVIANRRCGAFADLIEDGENGFLVEIETELADRAAWLLADRAGAARMAACGKDRALTMTWRAGGRALDETCRRAADARFSPSPPRPGARAASRSHDA